MVSQLLLKKKNRKAKCKNKGINFLSYRESKIERILYHIFYIVHLSNNTKISLIFSIGLLENIKLPIDKKILLKNIVIIKCFTFKEHEYSFDRG